MGARSLAILQRYGAVRNEICIDELIQDCHDFLAGKKKASKVTAIDNDDWAFNNAKENIVRNNEPEIEVLMGDSSLLKGYQFDLVIANINRNILLNDIPMYASALKTGGLIAMSGFYLDDLEIITYKAKESKLSIKRYISINNWCASLYWKE